MKPQVKKGKGNIFIIYLDDGMNYFARNIKKLKQLPQDSTLQTCPPMKALTKIP